MKRLLASTLCIVCLALASVGISIAAGQADLGFDANRMFFRYVAPSTGTVDFQMLPDNVNNPIVLPCDVQMFGGQADFNYAGSGPTVFPRLTATFFNGNNPIVSSGCLNNQVLQNVYGDLAAITAGTVQTDGYTLVSSTSVFCPWLFQPQDLPQDTVVRIRLAIAGYDDSSRQHLVGDPNPTNNQHDIFVRRSCACQ